MTIEFILSRYNVGKPRKRKSENKTPKSLVSGSDSGAESFSDLDNDLEKKYEKDLAERPPKKMRRLLPIKTKDGIMERVEEVDESDSAAGTVEEDIQEEPSQMSLDSAMDGTEEDTPPEDGNEVVSTVQLLAVRRHKLQHEKLRIGALCSSILESPERKIKNLFPIMNLMEERLKDGALNLHSIRKLATLSAYEVFKDILPEYHIRHQDYSNVKLKKETLMLYKYEKQLLEFYKRFLQRLEKATAVLRPKKGDERKQESTISLGLVSLRCMCGLLVARSNFNYATNIAQSVIPFLDCKNPSAVEIVTESCNVVFADDKRGEITLAIVRLINQLAKRREERLNPSALDCLLSLNIKDVDLDIDNDLKHKIKQEEKHKKRIVNLSKKEKKRAKKLEEVEKDLMETQAQESEMARRKQLTEVTRTVFHIYFRLLKAAPRSKLLSVVLNGLAKFTHVINLEFYSDLVAILARLLDDELVGARARLQCASTALCVLGGAGDALNVDPAKFHAYIYAHALDAHAGSTHEDAHIIIEAVSQICVRARHVSPAVLQAFAKRLVALAAQLPHNAALACLALLHQLATHSKPVSSLFEPDPDWGLGRFDPLLPSPEHCGAGATAFYELCALRRHYHPTVRAAATSLMRVDRILPLELSNLFRKSIKKKGASLGNNVR